jgi:hypothetical protein
MASQISRVANAPEPFLRSIVLALCDDPETLKRAHTYLGRLVARSSRLGDRATPKRKADEELHICVKCGDAFTDSENKAGRECWHHLGSSCILRLPVDRVWPAGC